MRLRDGNAAPKLAFSCPLTFMRKRRKKRQNIRRWPCGTSSQMGSHGFCGKSHKLRMRILFVFWEQQRRRFKPIPQKPKKATKKLNPGNPALLGCGPLEELNNLKKNM